MLINTTRTFLMVKKTSIWWNSEKEIITASRTTKKGPSWRKMVPAMSHISVLNLAMRESSWLSQKSSGLVFTTERCQWKTEKNFTTMTKIILRSWLLSRIWLPLTTLQLHITHGLHLPSCTALTHSHPPLHQSHSCHQSLSILIVSPHPHLIHTHTHLSSTLTCTHCEVLFCPGWHSERFPCILFPCVYLDCLYTLTVCCLPFWLCLPFDILSVCCLPRPLHWPCCWFCLAYVTPVITSDPCLFDLALLFIKAAFGS